MMNLMSAVRFITVLLFMFGAQVSLAIVDGHEYVFEEGSAIENQSRAQLFKQLAEELRCPKCQNQNLADSNAMIAQDLRRELYSQVKEGKGADDIVDFMVNRYGEFVLYRPALNEKTIFLWYGPIALLVLALLVFIVVVLQRRKAAASPEQAVKKDNESADENISAAEQQRIDQLLQAGSDNGQSTAPHKEGE